jgi:hypothetical protein
VQNLETFAVFLVALNLFFLEGLTTTVADVAGQAEMYRLTFRA